MATSWKAQQDLQNGKYYLQFETDDKEKYKQIEKLCQELVSDAKEEYVSNAMPLACKGCANHPDKNEFGLCSCTENLTAVEIKNKPKCKHNWVYIGLDEYRCSKCKERLYT